MRVTFTSYTDSFLTQLNRLATRQYKLQYQASTGQRIQFPEDDPAATRRVMNWQADYKSLSQYVKNLTYLKDETNITFDSVKGLKRITDRAREIATRVDGFSTEEDLKTNALEVTQLIQEAVSLTNTKRNDAYVFGGTITDKPPYVTTTNANGEITAITYQGNDSVPQVEIDAGSMISVRFPGNNSSSAGASGVIADSRNGSDLFSHLISLQNNLLAGDRDAISANDTKNLGADEENLISHLATIGVVQTRIEAGITLSQKRADAIDVIVSNDTDVDLPDTLTKLNAIQTSYQAALQVGSNIMSQSLLDFLR